jgi:hypothetical protein
MPDEPVYKVEWPKDLTLIKTGGYWTQTTKQIGPDEWAVTRTWNPPIKDQEQ